MRGPSAPPSRALRLRSPSTFTGMLSADRDGGTGLRERGGGAMSATVVTMLDCRGMARPLSVVKTAQAIKGLRSEDLFEVLATDPRSEQDFAVWCRATGNHLIAWSRDDGVRRFLIRKR